MSEELTVLPPESNDVPVLGGDSIIAVAREAEARVEAVTKIKMLALRVTNPNDWIDMGGKPYLQVSGAEKIARLFGISWQIDEPSFEVGDDGHYTYTYTGTFTLKGASVTVVGSRGTKDWFNAKSADQCDKADIKKAAYTNCIGRGITTLLGIRNLTWGEVEGQGIKAGARVEYKEKQPNKEGAVDNTKISIPQSKRLFAISREAGVDQEALKQYLIDEYGISHTRDIPRDNYEAICAWAQNGGKTPEEGEK